jgi:hypothetical protein
VGSSEDGPSDPPVLPEKDETAKTLSDLGIKYYHRNDQILMPSRIEEERAQNDLLVNRNIISSAAFVDYANPRNTSESPGKHAPLGHLLDVPLLLRSHGHQSGEFVSHLKSGKASYYCYSFFL